MSSIHKNYFAQVGQRAHLYFDVRGRHEISSCYKQNIISYENVEGVKEIVMWQRNQSYNYVRKKSGQRGLVNCESKDN